MKLRYLYGAAFVVLIVTVLLFVRPRSSVSTTFTGLESYEDGAVVVPGQVLEKLWACRVDATSSVVKDAYVKVVQNELDLGKPGLQGPDVPVLVVGTKGGVKPGDEFDIIFPITVPKELKDGLYELDVRLCDKQGIVYNSTKKPLYALLKVVRK